MDSLSLVFLLAVACYSVTCSAKSECNVALPSKGGWKDLNTGVYNKGGREVACVGPCQPVTDTAPFISTSAGQTIEEPINDSWFDSSKPYWCPTTVNYQTTGGKKKQWGYCACERLCSSFNNQNNCVKSLYSTTETACDWYQGSCMDKPNCSTANDVYSSQALKEKCEDIQGCMFYSGNCYDAPTTCAEVDELFGSSRPAAWESACESITGCYIDGNKCSETPRTCDEVNSLGYRPNKLSAMCDLATEGCYFYQGMCKPLPETCSQVNTELSDADKTGSKFKSVCENVPGCAVIAGFCLVAPTSCSEVNSLFSGQNIASSACSSVVTERCDVVDGICSQISSCSFYDNNKPGCTNAIGCAFSRGKCCSETSECLSYNRRDCVANSETCQWKGPRGSKSCVCLDD